jgi:murein DD-endopeptidase MepM/ murein hydrolase activator NlpD
MRNPIDIPLRRCRVNVTLHGHSVYRPKSVPGHNCFHTGWDGLDLFRPAGTPVKAMHSGVVIRISPQRNAKKSYVLIEGVGAKSLYAHVHILDSIQVGTVLKAGDKLGHIGRILDDSHVHVELVVNGKSVASSSARGLRAKFADLCGE